MFEALVSSVLNSVLGKYIKDLDTSNLDIGIFKGNVVLTDVELREDALAQFDLPVEVTHGYVGQISLKIPWTNPYSEPYVIAVQDVYLIASPIKERTYDPEKAKADEVAAKRKRLKKIEKAIKAKEQDQEDAVKKDAGGDSFTEKLVAQVVKNLQISVKNIHFRYEDKTTCPGSPFAVGFTLQNLSAETTDEFWFPCVVDGSETTVYKLVNLDCLAVYWNTNIPLAGVYGAQIDWKNFMDRGISSKSNTPSEYQFILKPLSAESHVIYDQSSTVSMDTPKLLIEVVQQELALSLTQTQFHNIMDLIESFELMAVNQLYLKYQPSVPALSDPKAWWKYAYTAICEEKIRCFSWERIKEHRRKFKEYKELYKNKLRGSDGEEWKKLLSDIQSLEDDVDIPSILIARQFAELEVPEHQRYHPHESQGKSWWRYLGIRGTDKTTQELKEEEDAELLSKLSVDKLPPEEKEKLYKAINYSDSAAPIKYPAQYVKTRISFNLDSFSVMMCDQSNREIAQLVTEGFAATLEQRPVKKGIRFSAEVNGFKMVGVAAEGEVSQPCLVFSKNLLKGGNKPLLEFIFETDPLTIQSADYYVCLKVEPVEALYHHYTIDRIVAFASSSNSKKLQELEVVAALKLNDLRIWTRAGLEYAITQHKVTYLEMDVRSPLIVIPEYGSLERDGSVLVLDLGHFQVLSNLASRDGTVRKASDTELQEMFYDRFDVTLEDVQIILANKGAEWRNVQNTDSSPFHILPSTRLELMLQKSISSDNPDLPEFKASSILPFLHLKLSDEKFRQLTKFLTNLPLSFNETLSTSAKEQSDGNLSKSRRLSTSTLSLEEASDLQAVCRSVFVAKHDSDEDDAWHSAEEFLPDTSSEERPSSRTSQISDKTKFAGSLVIKQVLIELDKSDEEKDELYLSLKIENLSTEVDAFTWETSIKAKLGSMQLLDHQHTDVDGSTLCVLSSSAEEDWITVNITKVNPKSPVFESKFNSVELYIVTRFSSLKLTAKQEAIASFETFVLNLFQSGEDELDWSGPRRLTLPTILEEDQLDDGVWGQTAEEESSVRGSSSTVIHADLHEVSLVLSAEGSHVGQVNISGLVVNIRVEEPQIKINTELKNFSILNLSEGSSYPEILSLEDNSLFDCEIVKYSKQHQKGGPTALDLSVNLKLGRLRFVFLNFFVSHVQNFVRAITSPETTAYARDITKDALKAQVKNIHEQGTKIGLQVVINAPRILIPCHSKSRDMLVADLGNLHVKNTISQTSEGALLDNMDIKLSSFKVSGFSPENKALSEHLLEPIMLEVTVKRRLGPARVGDLPFVQVAAVLEALKVNVGVSDYKLLMTVLNENFMEGKEELHALPESEVIAGREPHKSERNADTEFKDRTDAVAETAEGEGNIECNFVINKVTVSSPQLNSGRLTPYLLLDISKLSTTVVLNTWTFNAAASLGAITLKDRIGTDASGNPVSLMSSSRDSDLISVTYTKVDPRCPDFESEFCSTEQVIKVDIRKLNMNLVQGSLISLQEHVLALAESSKQTSEGRKPSQTSTTSGEKPESESSYGSSASLKVGATLSEVNILLSTSQREVAQITVKGLAVDVSLYEELMIVKSRKKNLTVIDLDTHTLYPKIISVENEDVFDFEFQLNSNKSSSSDTQLVLREPARLDGSLGLKVGRINVVVVYRFISDILKFVEPLTSPQSTRYFQETAQKTVTDQLEAAQSQGTCIKLKVSITAPLITLPRHSRSVDMLLLDLGHLELENAFNVCQVGDGDSAESVVFDHMELILQSVQLSRGVMDIGSSAVVKRRLVEPVKLNATISRSSRQSCSAYPVIDCSANLDFVKMNLGEKDYQLLTTITQDNLAEAETESVTDSGDSPANTSPSPTVEQSESADAQRTDTTDADSSAETSEYVWDRMVFSFQLAGANLTLYSKEKDLDPFDSQSPLYAADTALCLCEVEKSAVTIALLSDSSVQIHAQLKGCVVEDVRHENKTAFPRLVDKKTGSYASAVRSPELCEVMFCRAASGKMKVDLQLQNASIYVSLPFIWPLLRFFNGSPADDADAKPETISCAVQTETHAPSTGRIISDVIYETQMLPEKALPKDAAPLTSRPQAMPASQLDVTVQGVIKQPDFVLLGDPLRGDSEALIARTDLEFEYTMKNQTQTFFAALNDLQLLSCQFPDVKSSEFEVLSPCTVQFNYCTVGTDGSGQNMSVAMDTMAMKFFPGLLKTVGKVVTAIVGDQKADQSTQTVAHEAFGWDLWQPKAATSEYWSRKGVLDEEKPKFVTRKSTGEKLTVKTKEVRIELVNEIEGAHVPSLMVKSLLNASMSDWTAQLKLEADIAVEMSYYNEALAAWEPLLEPVVNFEETHMWELHLKVFMADGYRASFAPSILDQCDGPPKDVTDSSQKPSRGVDVTDARPRSWLGTPSRWWKRKSFHSSFRRPKRVSRRRRKPLTCGTTSDDDLDYDGALLQFVKASNKIFMEPGDGKKRTRQDEEENVDFAVEDYDTVDGGEPTDAVDGLDPVDAGMADDQAQALYVLLTSHDVMQLSVTPTTLEVLTNLTKVWTMERGEPDTRLRCTPRPLCLLRNELGVHASVAVSSKQKICDYEDEHLTIKHREVQTSRDQLRLFEREAPTTGENKTRKKFHIFSEPLLNTFKQRLQNIHKKRAFSEPISLTKEGSPKNVPMFEVGPPSWKRVHGKTVSSGGEDFERTPRGPGASLNGSDENASVVSQMSLSCVPPEDLDEHHVTSSQGEGIPFLQSPLAFTLANIGIMTTAVSSPHSSTELPHAHASLVGNGEQNSSTQSPPSQASVGSIPGKKEKEEDEYISVTVDGYYNVDYMHITRSGRYLYELWPRTNNESSSKRCIVMQVDVKNGHKTVTIRSALQIYNHLEVAVVVSVLEQDPSGAAHHKEIFTVDPQSTENVPLSAAYDQDLYLKPNDTRYNRCDSPLSWRELSQGKPSRVMQCSPTPASQLKESFNIKVLCLSDSLDRLPSAEGPHHVMHLYPPLVLHNLLPLELVYALQNSEVTGTIPEGAKVSLVRVSADDSRSLTVKLLNYCSVNWTGELKHQKAGKKPTVLVMTSDEENPQELTLGMLVNYANTTDIKIYSPYWLINKTGLSVEYRVCKSKQIYQHTASNTQPLLFNFTAASSRKARLRLPGHPWSKRFSLDAVGDSGKVTCKTLTSKKFEFVLQIQMSYTGLTKIVTLTPKYVIINTTEMALSFCEDLFGKSLWFGVDKGECKPFWPDKSKTKQLYMKQTMSNLITKPFPFGFSHTTVLRMPELQAVSVEVHGEMEDSVTTIVVMPYSPGVGTVRIVNLCSDIPIKINQKDVTQFTVLSPHRSVLYTWDNPLQLRRQLLWKPFHGTTDPVLIPTDKDMSGEVRVQLDDTRSPKIDDVTSTCERYCIPSRSAYDELNGDCSDKVDGLLRSASMRTIHWMSVMDGLQRVLLFTEDKDLAAAIRKCSDYESVKMEVFVSLDEVGLSLVNGIPQEVSYVTLSSSSSVWQIEKSRDHWKTLNLELSAWLEDHWRNPGIDKSDDDPAEVDFEAMEMVEPFKGKLRRTFEPALWFRYSSSEHFQSAHCKMHRLQIDNQLYSTVFPVVLYPTPLPSNVVERTGPKPFVEVSVILHQVPGDNICHVKYAKALVQEMNVRIDKGFIVAATGFFSKQSDDTDEEHLFQEDMMTVAVSLKKTSAVEATLQTQRVFLEYFHLSPLKINLSFSLSEVDEDEKQDFTEDMVDFFVDSIGATLTDINDAQLKMAFLERVGVFLTPENLLSQIIKHYTMQGVRQIYVLVLGLDVLGNPYGLISGIGEGFKDLFYEPYQGFVNGPQEFAEGLARGVRSLLGHVVGGTAGTFSRITGSLGGAFATLTFDSDFRKRRRRRMQADTGGVGHGMLEGGKSLAMGLIFGVSGVVMKPVEGARSEGVKGFFEGIGKGLLGLLTRPTGGVIDMVSFTLDGIRRSAEQAGADIACKKRIFPRFTAPALPLKPFSMIQAEGNWILKSLPRSLDFHGDVYEDHVPVKGDHSSTVVVLLTNKWMLKLHQQKIWGEEWKMDWSCAYDEVDEIFVTTNELIIRLRSLQTEVNFISHVHEVKSENRSELETLKTILEGALRKFRRTEPRPHLDSR